jgi:hypothetical protein
MMPIVESFVRKSVTNRDKGDNGLVVLSGTYWLDVDEAYFIMQTINQLK